MDEISVDTSSDIHFLENEKFDFDLPLSPTLSDDKIDGKVNDDDDEVFFGPVGFAEQCMSSRLATLQEDTNLKPLSPLSGEQAVELFTEATKIALHIERLSTEISETSLNQSHASSDKSSVSNSLLRLSNCSSSSNLSQISTGKSSSGSSDVVDTDKENILTLSKTAKTNSRMSEMERKMEVKGDKFTEVTPLAPIKLNTPVVKTKRSLPKPGSRGSKLPRSKNTEKSVSAFNSPIKAPEHGPHNLTADSLETRGIAQVKSIEKSGRRKSQQITRSSSFKHQSVPRHKTTPSTTKIRVPSTTTLAKRNIFRSTDSLTDDGAKDNNSSKLPVPEQSKIPGPKSRRRRSNSTSSVSSQSSSSSSKSQPTQDEGQSKSTRIARQVPSTKASLASSLPLGLIRRSKVHGSSNDKKPQPMKALPRSSMKSSRDSNVESQSSHLSRNMMRPPSDETKDDKIPLAATPQSQSSLPVARRRSGIKRPPTSNVTSSESTPRRNSNTHTLDSHTPSNAVRTKKTQPALSCQKRRSLIPTPGRNAPSPSGSKLSRNTSENPTLLSLAPAVKVEREPLKHFTKENEKMSDDDNHPISSCLMSAQSVDDLLQLDDAVAVMPDVIPIQPQPVSQVDLIDLSGT